METIKLINKEKKIYRVNHHIKYGINCKWCGTLFFTDRENLKYCRNKICDKKAMDYSIAMNNRLKCMKRKGLII